MKSLRRDLMSNGKYKILGLFTGKPQTLQNGQISAMKKAPVDSITVTKETVINDQIVDLKYHGGDMRVIHHYSKVNYDHLKNKFPEISDRFIPGSFGENIYTEELTEKDLFIGDIYQLGSAKVQITVARRPCATINNVYEDNRILKEVLQTGHVGWFYRVIEEGEVKVGDYLEFLERPYPDLKVSTLYNEGYGPGEKFKNLEFLKACMDTNLMDKGWEPNVKKALGL
jgi:MOSC domain-containing protein YiiM